MAGQEQIHQETPAQQWHDPQEGGGDAHDASALEEIPKLVGG